MGKTKKPARNGEIEFWRWIFCLIIFIYHISLDRKGYAGLFNMGQIGVEFFYIVSGYFLANKADREKDRDNTHLGKESITYVIKKYLGIFPYHLFAFAGALVIFLSVTNLTGTSLVTSIVHTLPQFFLVHMNGYLLGGKLVSVEWYISCLLIVTLFLYPLLRRFYDRFVFVACPLIALVTGGIMVKSGPLLGATEWMTFTTRGVYRALFEMCLGILAYEISKYLKEKDFSLIKRVILALISLGGYGFAVFCATSKMPEDTRYIVVLVLMVSVAITMSGKNLYGVIFNNGFFRYFGKLSLPFYLNTNIVRYICVKLGVIDMSYKSCIIISVGINIVISALLIFLVDIWKKHKKNKSQIKAQSLA